MFLQRGLPSPIIGYRKMNRKEDFVRRYFPRINVDIAAEIGLPGGSAGPGAARIINISRTGLFVLTDLQVREGEELTVSFRIPDEADRVTLKGKVTYLAEKKAVDSVKRGFGIRFDVKDVPETVKEQLREYFDSLYIYGWFS
jgi:Tfp pilus assembly protein PilZ